MTEYNSINPDNHFLIDSQTAKDLSLDDLYNKVNNTYTTYGDQILYHKLNSQMTYKSEIKMQISDLKHLRENKGDINEASKTLGKIGKQKRGNIVRDLWNGLTYNPGLLKFTPYWVLLSIISIIFSIFTIGSYAIWLILGVVVVNLLIFRFTNIHVSSASGSMNYLIRTLYHLKRLNKVEHLTKLSKTLTCPKSLNTIIKYKILLQDGFGFSMIGNDLFSSLIDYLRLFLCGEMFAYYKIYNTINNHKSEIRDVIRYIGYLDSLINSSNVVDNFTTSYPVFSSSNKITFEGLHHPLIDNCIPYSEEIKNNMIITGMNMAGKSTFMKSIAINQILSMSLGVTFSENYNSSYFYVISSMKVEDDIENSRSKYYMEAERLLYIQNQLKSGKVLCLIDEILTGTNTVDRIDASIGILKNYGKYSDSIILAATHDKEIAENLFPNYSNSYFDGVIGKNKIIYDYKLKNGIVTRRNAIQLLEQIGVEIS